MKTLSLFLMVALAALAELRQANIHKRDKRELLVRSKRRWVLSTIDLTEEDPGPFPREIAQMFNDRVDEIKKHHRFRITGKGVDEEPKGLFTINEVNGSVYVHGKIDREEHPLPFHIKFDILDKNTGHTIDDELSFDVEFKDINDKTPQFRDVPPNPVKVKENTEEGYLNVTVGTYDGDKEDTPNSEIDVTILKQTPAEPKFGLKAINPMQFHLTSQGCFNYDKFKSYEIILKAADQGVPVLSSTAVITLEIEDSNNHQPKFQKKEYRAEVPESAVKNDILRVAVDDKDTRFTPGWKAKYFFIKGNEDDHFQIETDPKTNEGILNVIKKKKVVITTNVTLEIGVENEEKVFACKDKTTGKVVLPPNDVAIITVKVIDENDPPVFEPASVDFYLREEDEPNKILITPTVHDPENDTIRYVKLNDEAGWVTVDSKTGQVKSAKKMDRESPLVDENGIYKVLIAAIDNGKPSATSTGTVLLHLSDINDNLPRLVNRSLILCGNKENKIMIPAKDADVPPYSGPFSFSLGNDDADLQNQWKLDPSNGMEAGLISIKPLPYGNYSVPVEIGDQQSLIGKETLVVIVCDCGGTETCLGKTLPSRKLGPAGIGMIFFAVLLAALLLLLFVFKCECGKAEPCRMVDSGSQSLIKYNEEGGGAVCAALPSSPVPSQTVVTATDGLKQATRQIAHTDSVGIKNMNTYNTTRVFMDESYRNNTHTDLYHRDTMGNGLGGQSMYGTQRTNMKGFVKGGSMRLTRSQSMRSNHLIQGYIDRRMYMMADNYVDQVMDKPHIYAYEGRGSQCLSLDELSLSNAGDDLHFLDNLDAKFKTLGRICHQTAK